jgi:MFS transporter, BCD family, chlorophyll transporter
MSEYRRFALHQISRIGLQWLPFADAASPDVPLARLLRLSLFQISVGMALALILGTLNRVMIVELRVPATLVALMLALPMVFAPLRALIGHRSDTHASALGWRRVPYIWKGAMLQWGGFAIMPFALLVLSGYGESHDMHPSIGMAAAGLAFLLVGAGLHMVQTVGLALATDLVPEEDQPKVVGLMYVMLLAGMIGAATAYGALLADYSPGRLIQVIQGTALLSLILNVCALWKQEARDSRRAARAPRGKPQTAPIFKGFSQSGFMDSWRSYASRAGALRLLVVVGLGTAAFGMADVVLEPYGGNALGMDVGATSQLTAFIALGGLAGFLLASHWLKRNAEPMRMASFGALAGIPAFAGIIASSQPGLSFLFVPSILLAGFGGGLFSHGTLTATMRNAPKEQIGLSLGAWGSVQATLAGVAIMIAGVTRDAISVAGGPGIAPSSPYLPVFALEIALLAAALIVAWPAVERRNKFSAAVAAPLDETQSSHR